MIVDLQDSSDVLLKSLFYTSKFKLVFLVSNWKTMSG